MAGRNAFQAESRKSFFRDSFGGSRERKADLAFLFTVVDDDACFTRRTVMRPLPAAGDGETASGHVSAVGGRERENFSSHSLFTVASCYSFLTFCI